MEENANENFSELIEKFLKKKSKEINKLAELYPEKKSLIIDYEELESFSPELSDELIKNPDEIISLFEKYFSEKDIKTLVENPRFHVRFKNLPKEKGYTIMVRDITSEYVNKFIAVEGVVNKSSDVLPKVYRAKFICNRCKQEHYEIQTTRWLSEPLQCKNCRKRDFRFDPDNSEWTDVQRLEIQEPLELLRGGEEARRIEIWLEDDIVDLVKPGDNVIINGIVRLRPPQRRGAVYQKFIEANWIEAIRMEFEEIEISEEEEKEIKKLSKDPKIHDKIIDSIAPSIYGYREIKEAIALQLFGGRPGKKLPDQTSVRPDIHILLIGDPGVAKSRILQYVNEIAPKSIYVTGKGTTGAGLTATAEKDEFAEGAWTLKAGALVLASGGIAAIDEFDKMEKEDRAAMHEALEQQTISIAKAGIVARFKANTSVLAASNPKFSRFDPFKPLHEQFDIPATLVSRFDLIFPIRDILDKEMDKKIAEHILKMHKGKKEDMEGIQPAIEPELFRKYIAYARKNIFPVLTDEAAEKLGSYYVELRSRSKETVSSTPRQLEALIRLAEASAKVRLSDIVTISDAERAIKLTEFVLREVATDETGRIDIDRIATEHPQAMREKVRSIEEIIQSLIDESVDKTASYDDILNEASAKGIDKFTAERLIEELKRKGVIFEPKQGKFMFTEG
ncbi:MAG: minichromosome maintenance protein MCM [Candidatus Altiarchaeota archaeon]